MSDAAVTPPVRIQAGQSVTISSEDAHARIASFLEGFQQRSTLLSGGDATVPAQLSKLAAALAEEENSK